MSSHRDYATDLEWEWLRNHGQGLHFEPVDSHPDENNLFELVVGKDWSTRACLLSQILLSDMALMKTWTRLFLTARTTASPPETCTRNILAFRTPGNIADGWTMSSSW